MNYYKRHLGDYAKDTGHLSVLEHGAYTLLLDFYYATEKPIQADKAYRIAQAHTKPERAAVDAVLAEFFQKDGDSYRQSRCDREILEAHESEEEGDARREHERERQRRHRERRKELFAALRERGEVPAYDTSTTDLEALLKRCIERDGNAPVTRDVTAIHKPLANSHKPEKRESAPAFLPDENWKPTAETIRMRLRLGGRPETWGPLDEQKFIANARQKGVSKTANQWDEAFALWMLREPAFSGGVAANNDSGAAAEAFAEVRQRIRDGKGPGDWKHPQTDAALEAVGGWHAMKGADAKANDFRERPFVAAFNQARAA